MPRSEQVTHKISIVVPVYNEEENLKPLTEEIFAVVDRMDCDYEIILVDDGSSDSSTKVISELAAQNSKIKGIFLARNFGQTAAMSAGTEQASGDVLFFLDADRQNDPSDIPRMLEKLNEGYDVVSGWRKNRKDKKLTRKIPSKLANKLISAIGGVPIHDLGCSLKAYRMSIIKDINLYGEMHRFIPIYAKISGGKVTEVEVNHRPRVAGVSKYGLNRTFKVILDLIVVKFLMTYSTRPMHFFGGVGLWLTLGSILSLSSAVARKLLFGVSMVRNPLLLFSVMLLILAVNFILMGILSEMQMRTYYESQGKKSYAIKSLIGFIGGAKKEVYPSTHLPL